MARRSDIYEPVAVEIDGETVFMPRWMTQVTPHREPKRVRSTTPEFDKATPVEPRRRLLESLTRH